ncbi:MAG: APC family permease [Acidobacteria bacterium]|nr:APC family permease [Acidobacteriota bacterium]
MYAFGATLGYTLVFISLIRLRFTDPYSPRPYKVPFNVKVKYQGQQVDLPILGFIGTAGVLFVLAEVVLTHEIGRIAGPAWVVLCFMYYAWYRRKVGMPVFKRLQRDWETEQKVVLESAEEYDLLERYRIALAERDRSQRRLTGEGKQPKP